jgi:hypothetical protein
VAIGAIALVDERFRQPTIQPVDVTEVAPRMPINQG